MKCKNAISFAVGLFVGIIFSQKYFKDKYKAIADEEILSVKNTFVDKNNKSDNVTVSETKEENSKEFEAHKTDYISILKKQEYLGERAAERNKPYIITPEEFGELDDFDTVSLTYYADDVLADENDEPIDNVDEMIGLDSLSHFGEYEDDSIFVRNEEISCDFEVLRDIGNYSEIFRKIPVDRRYNG